MKIAVLYNDIDLAGSREDEADCLMQMQEISAILSDLGHDAVRLPFRDSLSHMEQDLKALSPDCVFNLVETAMGSDSQLYIVPQKLEEIRIPYTGCRAAALQKLSDKPEMKRILLDAGIPTPEYYRDENHHSYISEAGSWIVKSATEHASLGIDATNIVPDLTAAKEKIQDQQATYGGIWFAERFIDGREFNISMMQGDDGGAIVLPIAEIRFQDFFENHPKIVDYAAKWLPDSPAYTETPTGFDYGLEDAELLDKLRDICRRCWDLFNMNAICRVDFRVDRNGNPYVLEVNGNPCLSSDAGFMKAARKAGYSEAHMIDKIFRDARPEQPNITFRTHVTLNDVHSIRHLVSAAGVFNEEEVQVAGELAEEALDKGEEHSGYSFIFAEQNGMPVGYACYGHIPMTANSYALYWIVTSNSLQRRGIAAELLGHVEKRVQELGGGTLYAETSGTDLYKAARGFYQRNGFDLASTFPDFYAPGDAKLVYAKHIDNIKE